MTHHREASVRLVSSVHDNNYCDRELQRETPIEMRLKQYVNLVGERGCSVGQHRQKVDRSAERADHQDRTPKPFLFQDVKRFLPPRDVLIQQYSRWILLI